MHATGEKISAYEKKRKKGNYLCCESNRTQLGAMRRITISPAPSNQSQKACTRTTSNKVKTAVKNKGGYETKVSKLSISFWAISTTHPKLDASEEAKRGNHRKERRVFQIGEFPIDDDERRGLRSDIGVRDIA